jgi:hypothetical protein
MTADTGVMPARTMREAVETRRTEPRREPTNLSGRYGAIGISAVAAAMRYAGATKNPAYAPVATRHDLRFTEFAAA